MPNCRAAAVWAALGDRPSVEEFVLCLGAMESHFFVEFAAEAIALEEEGKPAQESRVHGNLLGRRSGFAEDAGDGSDHAIEFGKLDA